MTLREFNLINLASLKNHFLTEPLNSYYVLLFSASTPLVKEDGFYLDKLLNYRVYT